MEFEANNCDEETTDATNKNTNSKGKITANTDVEQIKLENQTTKQLYASLLHEYEETRHQLAEARLHIDRLRLGANVDIHKHYILNHNTVENATIRPRISAIVDCNTLPTITLPLPATRLIANTIVNDKHVCKAAMMTENGTQCYQDITTSEDEDDTIIEPHNTSENLQQIAKLQHRLAALHDKTKDSDISLDDIYSELIDLHQLHQDLASNVNSWKETNGNDDDDNKMVEDELIKLAQQLQEFTGLLKLKSQQLIQASQDKKRENTELSLQSNTASDSNLEIHGCNHEVPAHFFIATKSNTQSLTSDFTESNASSANSLTLQKHQMYIPEDIENTFKTEISYHEPQTISPSCYTHAHIRPQTSSQTQTQMNAHSPSYQTHTHINPQTGNPSYWDHTNTECQTSNPSNQTYTHMERHMSSPSYQTHSSQSHTHTKPQTGYQPHSSQTQTFMEPQTGNPSHETHTHTKPHGLSNQNCTHMRPHSLSNQTHTSTEPQTHSTSNQIYTHTNPQTNSPSCHHTEPQIRNPSYQICTHTEGHQTGSPPYQTHTHMEPQPQCSSPLYQTHTHANPQSDSLPYQTRTHMEPQSGSPPYQTHSHMEPQCSSPLYQNHTHANPQSDSPPYQTRTHMEPQSGSPPYQTHSHMEPQCSSPLYQTHTHANLQSDSPPYQTRTHMEPQSGSPPYQTHSHMEPQCSSPLYQTHTHANPQSDSPPYQTHSHTEPQCSSPLYQTHTHANLQSDSPPYQTRTHIEPQPQCSSPLYQTHTHANPQSDSPPYQTRTHMEPQSGSPPYQTHSHMEPQCSSPLYQTHTHANPQSDSPPYQTRTHMEPQPQCSSPLYQTHTHANPQSDSPPCQTCTHMEPQSGSPPWTHSPFYQTRTYVKPQTNTTSRADAQTHLSAMTPLMIPVTLATTNKWLPSPEVYYSSAHVNTNIQPSSPIKTLPVQNNATNSSSLLVGTGLYSSPQSTCTMTNSKIHQSDHTSQGPVVQRPQNIHPMTVNPSIQIPTLNSVNNIPVPQAHNPSNMADLQHQILRTEVNPSLQKPIAPNHVSVGPTTTPFNDISTASFSQQFKAPSHVSVGPTTTLFNDISTASFSQQFKAPNHVSVGPTTTPFNDISTASFSQQFKEPNHVSVGPTTTSFNDISTASFSQQFKAPNHVSVGPTTTSFNDISTASFSQQFKEPNHVSVGPTTTPFNDISTASFSQQFKAPNHVSVGPTTTPFNDILTASFSQQFKAPSHVSVGPTTTPFNDISTASFSKQFKAPNHVSVGPTTTSFNDISTASFSQQFKEPNHVSVGPTTTPFNDISTASFSQQFKAPNHVSVGPTTTPFNDILTASFSQQFKAPSHVSVGPTTTPFNDISTASFSKQFKAPNHVSVGPTTTSFNDISTASFSQQFKEPNHVSVGPTTTPFNDISTASFSQQFKAPNHVSVGPTTTPFNDILTASFSQQFKAPSHVSVGPTTTPFNDISTASFSKQFKAPNHVSVGPTTTSFNDISTASFSQQFKEPNHVSVGPTTTSFNDISTASFSQQFKAPNHVSVCPTTTPFNDILTASFSQQQFKAPNQVSVVPITTPFNDISNDTFSQQFKPQSAHNLQPQQHPTPIISSMQTPMHYIPTTDQLHSSLPAPVTTMYLPPYSAPITAASVSFSGTSKHHKPLRPSSLPHNSMDNLHSLYNTPSINDMYQEQPMYTSNAQSHDKSHDRFPLSVHTSSNQRLTELTKSCYPSLSGIDVSNQRTVYPSDAPSIMAIHQKPSNTQPFLVQESSNQGNHTNDDSTMRSTPVDTPRSSHQLTKNQRAVHSTSKPTGYDRQKGSSSNIVSPSSVERPPRHRIVPFEKEPVTSQSLHYDIDSDSSGSTDHKLGPERTRTKHRHPKDEKGQAGYNRRAQKGKSTISKPKERPSTTSLENTKTLKRVLPHIPSPPRPESFKTSQQNWPDQKNKGLIPVQHHFATEMDSGFVESEDTRHQQNPSPLVYPGDTYQSVLSSEDENHHSIDHERDRRDTDVSSVASSKASHNTVAAIDSLRQDFVNLKEELQSIMQKPDTQEVSKSLRIDNSEPEQQYKTGKVSTPLQLSKPAHKRHRGEKVTLNKSHRKRLHKRGVDKAITACPVQHDKETQASFLNTSHTHNTSNRIRSKDQPQKIIHRYKPIIRSSSSLESLSSSIETTLNQDSSVTSLSTIVTPVRKHTAKKYWQQYSESEDSIVRGSKYTGTSNNGSRLSSENSDNEHKGNSKYQFRSSSRKPTQILTTYDSSPHHYMEDTEQTILLSLPQRPKPKHKEFHKSRPNSSGTHILESTPTTMRTRKSHHNVRPIPPHSNIPNPPHIYCNNNKRHTHFSVPHNEDHNHCDTCYPHPTNLTRSLSNISELHTRENRNQPQRTIILETLPFSSIAKVVDTNSRDQLPIVSFDEQTRDQLPVVAVDEQTRDTLPVVAFDEHTKVILDTVSLDEAEELAVKLKRSSERINRNLRDKMSLSN